ncbi:pectin acetylesterase-family hydrolase [Aquabacterium sp.]|uniref:pectin acetylesterase-family hydrolase n=1 Tax=Aquabacterium sp. TaxID=1872578 RepID=UPI003784D324
MNRSIALAGVLAALAVAPLHAAEGWQTIDNPPAIIGADGLPHQATCSGFPGTNPRYRFWVRPGDPKKLAVIFDGGGACWDDLTCSHPSGGVLRQPLLQFYTPAIPKDVDPSQYDGLLDLNNPANPVKDWTLVALPYCTADVHLGSADHVYQKVARPGFPRGDTITIHHRGYDNFMVVLDWIGKNVGPDLSDLFVTGASAGGYGASAHFPWLARQFPQARLSVLADASQGVSTPAFDANGRANWNVQLPAWVFGSTPLAVPSNDLLRRGAQAYTGARFAQYTTTQDEVQTGFYGYMKVFYGPGGNCPLITPDWNRQMLGTLSQYKTSLPNFRAYVLPGTKHTIIGDNGFYADSPAGPTMAAWTGAMLDWNPSAPAWDNAACPDCLTPMPCRRPAP